MRRAILPALGNDPEGRCEPLGLTRLVTFSGGGATMDMVQVKDRIIQRFEWTWDNREIWMDGRALPNVDDYLPRYNGYSVGKWEGDTLVVTSTGFDDRQWVDQFGYPISDKMVLEERYTRPSPNRLRVDMTITDPVMYTRPWHSSPKIWALIPKKKPCRSAAGPGSSKTAAFPATRRFSTSFATMRPGRSRGSRGHEIAPSSEHALVHS